MKVHRVYNQKAESNMEASWTLLQWLISFSKGLSPKISTAFQNDTKVEQEAKSMSRQGISHTLTSVLFIYEALYDNLCSNFLILRIFSLANSLVYNISGWLLRVLKLKVYDAVWSDFLYQTEVSWLVRVKH